MQHQARIEEDASDVQFIYKLTRGWRTRIALNEPKSLAPRSKFKEGSMPNTNTVLRMSVGELTEFKVNWHQLEDRERNQMLEYVQLQLLEYMVLTNQNIQLDPILVHLRLIAQLQKWGDPNYGTCINTINEIKRRVKFRELSASLLYLMIQGIIYPNDKNDLYILFKDFFNMLIVNKTFDYLIGPPLTIDVCIHDEKQFWADHMRIHEDIQSHMIMHNHVANSTNTWKDKKKLNWIAENPWVTVKLRLRLQWKSDDFWMEYVSFQRMIKWEMINEIDRPGTCSETKKWIFDTMEKVDYLQRTAQRHHAFPNPPILWLSNFMPRINQSVLLATAFPPVVADMSTVAKSDFRFPLQWATFCQYRHNLTVERNPLPIHHSSLLSEAGEEY